MNIYFDFQLLDSSCYLVVVFQHVSHMYSFNEFMAPPKKPGLVPVGTTGPKMPLAPAARRQRPLAPGLVPLAPATSRQMPLAPATSRQRPLAPASADTLHGTACRIGDSASANGSIRSMAQGTASGMACIAGCGPAPVTPRMAAPCTPDAAFGQPARVGAWATPCAVCSPAPGTPCAAAPRTPYETVYTLPFSVFRSGSARAAQRLDMVRFGIAATNQYVPSGGAWKVNSDIYGAPCRSGVRVESPCKRARTSIGQAPPFDPNCSGTPLKWHRQHGFWSKSNEKWTPPEQYESQIDVMVFMNFLSLRCGPNGPMACRFDISLTIQCRFLTWWLRESSKRSMV